MAATKVRTVARGEERSTFFCGVSSWAKAEWGMARATRAAMSRICAAVFRRRLAAGAGVVEIEERMVEAYCTCVGVGRTTWVIGAADFRSAVADKRRFGLGIFGHGFHG